VENHTVSGLGRAIFRTVTAPSNISGQVVRRLRVEQGLSQPDFARRCQLAGWDVSRDIIARIEGGTRLVRDAELVKLASVLGVTPNDLVGVK
jgi:transcriptional regulator with XRE-family HTH domain